MPGGGGRGDLDFALAHAVPARHAHLLPEGGRVDQDLGQGWPPHTLLARAPDRTGKPWGRWIVECRIQAQTGDGGDAAAAQSIEKQQGREGAVADQHEIAPRQPAPHLQGHLPSDIEQGLGPMTAFPAGALRGDEGGQKRQCPDPTSLGDGREQHQAHPAQAARLDEGAPDERTGSR